MITNHSKNRIIARTGLGPDKRVIICVAIIFGSTTSPIGPTIHMPYTIFTGLPIHIFKLYFRNSAMYHAKRCNSVLVDHMSLT